MSRYEIAGRDPTQSVAFGWDRPLGKFFVSVLALPQDPSGEEMEVIEVWMEPTTFNAWELTVLAHRYGDMGEANPLNTFDRLCSDAGISNRYTPKAHEYARVRAKREGVLQ